MNLALKGSLSPKSSWMKWAVTINNSLTKNELLLKPGYDRVEKIWKHFETSPQRPGVVNIACEGWLSFTTGRWGTSPTWGLPPPCEQAQEQEQEIWTGDLSCNTHIKNIVMYQSNRSFNIPPRATPWAFEFLENFCSNSLLTTPKSCSNAPPPGKLLDCCFNFSVAPIKLRQHISIYY